MARPKVLFLTLPEFGQANCQLATISALQEAHGDAIDIHLASFAVLGSRVPTGVTFHPLVGTDTLSSLDASAPPGKTGKSELGTKTMSVKGQQLTRDGGAVVAYDKICHPPGIIGTYQVFQRLTPLMYPCSPEEYVASAQSAELVIAELKPDLTVLDCLFEAGHDAVIKQGVRFVRLSPNTVKEMAMQKQGLGVFRWPCLGSGLEFPCPWYKVPYNIIGTILPLFILTSTPEYKALVKARHAAGYPGPMPTFDMDPKRDYTVLCMSTVGADIPAFLPESVVCCGPILQRSTPAEVADPALFDWLKQRPTVLIVLGSFFLYRESYAREMLAAARVLLEKRKDIQVLWKLQKYGDYDLEGTEVDGRRLKVVKWLEADPFALLQTGNVVCFVNHGGSNSYHEGLATGTPQILLPAWVDCYDFTCRLPLLGHGVWGNKTSAPLCSEPELTKAFMTVVGATPDAPEAHKIRERAKELGEIVSQGGKRLGRNVAAEYIWKKIQEAAK
ncbi:hypothetical protein IAT38_003143 [Cryptococcus sp. DSM 104549]